MGGSWPPRLIANEAREAKEQAKEQVGRDQAGGAVPPERLCNLLLKQLTALLVRLEGGKLLPYCVSKEGCIARILTAGYAVEVEAGRERKEEEERAALKAAEERKAEEAKVKREEAAALKAAMEEFLFEETASASSTLTITPKRKEEALAVSLRNSETQDHLAVRVVPGKGKKEALPARPVAG